MIYLINLILVILAGLFLWLLWKYRKEKEENAKEFLLVEKERDEYMGFGKGLEEYNQKLREKKNAAKNGIMEMVSVKGKISSSDIVSDLDISHTSAMRYLDELEKEGGIRQVGKTGRNVFYTK
ncbi:MAG: hypothetical protein ABIJ84_01775 [bacterium]